MKYRRGILTKKLPPDPDWSTLRTFSNLRNFAWSQPPEPAAPNDNPSDVPRNQFAPSMYPDLVSRIDALYDAHKITPGDDDALLFALVTTHVPGLTVQTKPGPKTKWSRKERARLRVAVDEYIKSHPASMSVARACEILAAKPEWSSMLRATDKNPGIALCKQYDLAEAFWIQLVRDQLADERWAAAHPEEAAKQQQWGSRLLAFEQALNKRIAAHPEQAAKQRRMRLPKSSKRSRARKDKKR